MAQKVQVLLVDDVDGGEADESVTFALDGISYEIDLSSENAEALRGAMAPWIGHARKLKKSAMAGGKGARGGAKDRSYDPAEVRAWARENGYQVSDRGRVSADILAAYENAG